MMLRYLLATEATNLGSGTVYSVDLIQTLRNRLSPDEVENATREAETIIAETVAARAAASNKKDDITNLRPHINGADCGYTG